MAHKHKISDSPSLLCLTGKRGSQQLRLRQKLPIVAQQLGECLMIHRFLPL